MNLRGDRRVLAVWLPRIMVLGLATVLVGAVMHYSAWAQKPAQAKEKPSLEGAWRLVSVTDPRTGKANTMPEGTEDTKLVVGGRFIWTIVKDGKVMEGVGGTYAIKGNTYTEKTIFSVTENFQYLLNQTVDFSWKIEDGKWHHVGTLKGTSGPFKVDEIWERVPTK